MTVDAVGERAFGVARRDEAASPDRQSDFRASGPHFASFCFGHHDRTPSRQDLRIDKGRGMGSATWRIPSATGTPPAWISPTARRIVRRPGRIGDHHLQIKVGYELIYDCPQPTPMMLVLHVHYSRASDLDRPGSDQDHAGRPAVGLPRRLRQLVLAAWSLRPGGSAIASMAVVRDSGEPDASCRSAWQHAVQDLPEEALVFLLGSRYCDTEKLSEVAWNLFGQTPPGWARVQAICDFVHNHIAFGYEHARATKTACAGLPGAQGRLPRLSRISPSRSAAA